MKKITTAEMLMPKYVSRFECIGGDCEDTCCAGWRVDLDKESFLLYQASFDPLLRPLFSRYVKKNPDATRPARYGTMSWADDACRECGLLSGAKRCRIQEQLGEQALSDTCASYPRKVHRLGDLHQMTLNLSCPEAARLALLAEDAFEFVGLEQGIRSGSVEPVEPRQGVSLPMMDDVRMSMLQVLQTRELDLPTRMKVMGMFCGSLTTLIRDGKQDEIPLLLDNLDSVLESGEVFALLANLNERRDAQAHMASIFFEARRADFQTPHQRRVFDLVAQGLGVQDGVVDRAVLLERYDAGLARLAPALAHAPWLLEHFLLNEALIEVFPWEGKHPLEHFTTLLMRFAIIRLMLAGRAVAQEDPLTTGELAETVQVFARLYLHNEGLKKNINQALRDSGWGRLEKLYNLL